MMVVGEAALAAAMCMLTQTTDTQEKAGGATMSDVNSMHSGVAKLLDDRTGHQGPLIKAKMGGERDWSASSRESSKKVSRLWRFNTREDGSILCAGLTVDMQRLHSALVKGQYLSGDYGDWNGDLSKTTFDALLKIAPWAKMERKAKDEGSKENGEKKNQESIAPKGKASKGGETPHSSALPPVYTERGVALRGALAAAAVLRQQLSEEDQSEESGGALRQLDAALTYMEDAPDEAVR